MNRVAGHLSIEHFGELGGCLELLFLKDLVQQDGSFIIVVVVVRDGDAPEGEFISGDIIKSRGLFGLDEFLEDADCLGRLNLDRERGRFTINKAEQVQVSVGHGAAKHQKRSKIMGFVQTSTNADRQDKISRTMQIKKV